MAAPPLRSVQDSAPESLPDVRAVLSRWPYLSDHPEALATLLKIDEHEIQKLLEALLVEGEVLA